MASTKQMQLRAKLRKEIAKARAAHPDCKILGQETPVKLYVTNDVVRDEFGLVIQTLEGIQAYKTALVNVSYIPRGSQAPLVGFNTGYGLSYMSKVISGTPRAREILINAFANGDESDDMLQISATECGTKYNEAQLVAQAILSLPKEVATKFANRKLKVESGTSPTPLGFAPRMETA
jgi:hypothetical protein